MPGPQRVSDPSLPSPWVALEADGVKYYWNSVANVTQYERPAGAAQAPTSAQPLKVGCARKVLARAPLPPRTRAHAYQASQR